MVEYVDRFATKPVRRYLRMSLIVQDCGSIDSVLAAHANGKCDRHDCQWYDSVLISDITDMTKKKLYR